ncbi:MAG: hypothetical protein P9L96_02525 [Candidatus Gygaella obscura]|nr:hypothetical protein [Candidatus Gygaella obscura]
MFNKRAQSTLEYAVIISVVVGALIAMRVFMKRGIEGKLHDAANDIGDQFDASESYVYTKTTRTGTTISHTNDGQSATYTDRVVSTREGSEAVNEW